MTTTRARALAIGVLGLRVAYGAALAAAPTPLAERWLGPAAGAGPTKVPLRGLGARELIFHTGALAALLSGAPVRPWLGGSIAGDLADIAATIAEREQLPDGSATATLLVAGSSALLSAVVAAVLER